MNGKEKVLDQLKNNHQQCQIFVLARGWDLLQRSGEIELRYLSSRSDFGFEFTEIFVFEKRLPAITDTGSCRLRISVIQGVANSPHHWYAESPTPRITDTRSRQLPASPIRRVGYWIFLKKTLRIDDTESRRVADSVYHRYGESTTPCIVLVWESTTPCIGDRGSRYSTKNLIWCRFS